MEWYVLGWYGSECNKVKKACRGTVQPNLIWHKDSLMASLHVDVPPATPHHCTPLSLFYFFFPFPHHSTHFSNLNTKCVCVCVCYNKSKKPSYNIGYLAFIYFVVCYVLLAYNSSCFALLIQIMFFLPWLVWIWWCSLFKMTTLYVETLNWFQIYIKFLSGSSDLVTNKGI